MSQHQPQVLIAGANAALPEGNISVRIISDSPIDCAAYRLTHEGKVRGDGDMVFYGQQQSDDGSVCFRGHDSDGFFDIRLGEQPASIDKIALAFSSDQALAQVGDIDIQVLANTESNNTNSAEAVLSCHLSARARTEKAIILAECYRRQGQWKFRFIDQGFNGGLKPLSEHFGVEIADVPEASANANGSASLTPPPIPAPTMGAAGGADQSSVTLKKITLTKTQSSINLKKRDDFGHITVNLNWNQCAKTPDTLPKRGKLSDLFKQHNAGGSGIDLDIGAMVQLKNGDKTLIQALGNRFGDLETAPYVRLRADDRTGQVSAGEWLDINGRYWAQIEEVFIFAFIYAGVPNWAQTDGVVTIYVPDQPPIETQLTEGTNHSPMCAIARLSNQQGSITVTRINQYFQGHQQMDNAFNWGFNWKRGRK